LPVGAEELASFDNRNQAIDFLESIVAAADVRDDRGSSGLRHAQRFAPLTSSSGPGAGGRSQSGGGRIVPAGIHAGLGTFVEISAAQVYPLASEAIPDPAPAVHWPMEVPGRSSRRHGVLRVPRSGTRPHSRRADAPVDGVAFEPPTAKYLRLGRVPSLILRCWIER
jgi:hypothetical protein